MKDFKTLQVWHKAHAIVLHMYKVSASFPKEELYGLTSQIRRAGHLSLQTWLKVVDGIRKLNWLDLRILIPALLLDWNIMF